MLINNKLLYEIKTLSAKQIENLDEYSYGLYYKLQEANSANPNKPNEVQNVDIDAVAYIPTNSFLYHCLLELLVYIQYAEDEFDAEEQLLKRAYGTKTLFKEHLDEPDEDPIEIFAFTYDPLKYNWFTESLYSALGDTDFPKTDQEFIDMLNKMD